MQNDNGTSALNQIAYIYNGTLSRSDQEHDGTVDGSSQKVNYLYDTSATSTVVSVPRSADRSRYG